MQCTKYTLTNLNSLHYCSLLQFYFTSKYREGIANVLVLSAILPRPHQDQKNQNVQKEGLSVLAFLQNFSTSKLSENA